MVTMLCVSINANAQIPIITDLVVLDLGQVRAGQFVDVEIPILNPLNLDGNITVTATERWDYTLDGYQTVGVAVSRDRLKVSLRLPDYPSTGPIEGDLNIIVNVDVLLGLPLLYTLELPMVADIIL